MVKIVQVRVCAPTIEKEDDLEDILATDDLFVEYFNEYLSLPVFLEPLWFNRDLGTFEVVDGAKQKVAKRLKAAIRASKGVPKIYRPAQRHSFSTISLIPLEGSSTSNVEEIDTSFSVTMLNKEQGMKWVKTHRFPTFLRSDLYVEYRLAKIVSQVDCAEMSGDEPIKVTLDATPFAKKVKPEELLPPDDVDDTDELLKNMCVCMGATPTTDVDNWVSLARTQLHTATNVTSSSQIPRVSANEADSSASQLGSSSARFASPIAHAGSAERAPPPPPSDVYSKLFLERTENVAAKSVTPRPEDAVCLVLDGAGGGILDKLPARSSALYVTTTAAGSKTRQSDRAISVATRSAPTEPEAELARSGGDDGSGGLVFPSLESLSAVLVGTALKHALAAASGGGQPSDYKEHAAVRTMITDGRHRDYTLDELDSACCSTDAVDDLGPTGRQKVGRDGGKIQSEDSDDSGYAAGAVPEAGAAARRSSLRSGPSGQRGPPPPPPPAATAPGAALTGGAEAVAWTARQLQTVLKEAPKGANSEGHQPKASTGGEEDSALESDSDYEEADRAVFKRRAAVKKHSLASKKGIDKFKGFLKGTVGERNWELWLDIDRARLQTSDNGPCNLEYIKGRYYSQGACLELSTSAKEELGLSESFQWTLSNLFRLQSSVAEPLLTYWAPRYVLQRSLPRAPLELNPEYRQYMWVTNAATVGRASSATEDAARRQADCLAPVGPAVDVTTPVTLPLRPKSCAPRLYTVLSEKKKYEGPTPKEFSYAPPAQVSLPDVTPPLGQRRAQSAAAVELVRSKAKLMTEGGAEKYAAALLASSSSESPGQARAQSARPASSPGDSGATLRGQQQRRPATSSPRPAASVRRDDGAPSAGGGRASRLARQGSERSQSALSRTSDPGESSKSPVAKGAQPELAPTGAEGQAPSELNHRAETESTTSSDVSAELFGGRRMELLLKALSNEGNSGKFFRKSVEASKNKRTLSCLLFWEDVQEYRHLFYGATFSSYAAHKKAQEIFSLYIAVTGRSSIGCSFTICHATAGRLHPPYEDLFDAAEEFALGVLFEAWQVASSVDMAALNEVDTKTFTRALETKTKYVISLQRRGLLKSSDNLLEDPMEGYKDPVYDPTLIDKIPEDFRDFTFEKLVRTPIYLETYRQFLQANFASTDLNCWSDIEQFRRLPPDATSAADTKAREIKTKYLNKRYFFGPNSPATREGLDQIMRSVGGWGNVFPDRPPDQLIIHAQAFVQERLEKKWMPLFLASRQFEELHRPDQHMADAAEAILLQKRRKNQAIYKMLESKWISSSNEIMAFRKALLNPVLSYQFQRYVSIKSDSLENDVLFWKEVQKYKKMHHSHTSEAFIQQKINVIISCFVDSSIPPAIQIDIPPEQAERILDKRREMGPYLFREAQLAVFRVLFEYWGSFCEFRSNVSTDEVVSTLERHRRRAKLRERKRSQKLEEQKEKEIARRRALGLPIDDEDDDVDGRAQTSSYYNEHVKETDGGESQDVPKVSWSYSHYIYSSDREDLLSRTDDDTFSSLMDEDVFTELHRMRQPLRPNVSSVNVSDLRDVKSSGNKDAAATAGTEPSASNSSPSKSAKHEHPRSAASAQQQHAADKQSGTAGRQSAQMSTPSAGEPESKKNGGGVGGELQPQVAGGGPKASQRPQSSASGQVRKHGVTFADASTKTSTDSSTTQPAAQDRRATLQSNSMGAMVAAARK